jgi:hypothetical protein
MYKIGAAGHPCLAERDIAKNFDMKPFVFGQPVKEAKICMFADDTQLLNKNEESVEQSFLILSKFEKASGSKINYEKTKGLFISLSG